MVFNFSTCSEERKGKILAITNPFVSVGNCSGMYRCDALFSSMGGDSFHVSDT